MLLKDHLFIRYGSAAIQRRDGTCKGRVESMFEAFYLLEVMADLLMLLGEKLTTQVGNFKKARPIMESFKTSKCG